MGDLQWFVTMQTLSVILISWESVMSIICLKHFLPYFSKHICDNVSLARVVILMIWDIVFKSKRSNIIPQHDNLTSMERECCSEYVEKQSAAAVRLLHWCLRVKRLSFFHHIWSKWAVNLYLCFWYMQNCY